MAYSSKLMIRDLVCLQAFGVLFYVYTYLYEQGIYMRVLTLKEYNQLVEMCEGIMSRGENNGKTAEEVYNIMEKRMLDKQQKSVIISDTKQ